MTAHKRFIIWDPRDGEPQRDNGEIVSDGNIGRVSEDNVYIRCYPSPLPGEPLPQDLEIGHFTVARYSLSGSSGVYRIYRVADYPPAPGERDPFDPPR